MTRRKKLFLLGALAVAFIGAGSVFILWTVGGTATLERDEAGRDRSCGVRTSLDGRKYCASELAAKNPQAMHRCPEHDGAVIVKYVEANGEESQREICCICGRIQTEPQHHANMTGDAIERGYARAPVCWQPGQGCPRDGRVPCAKLLVK